MIPMKIQAFTNINFFATKSADSHRGLASIGRVGMMNVWEVTSRSRNVDAALVLRAHGTGNDSGCADASRLHQ
jgi:hypothetical protein